MPDALRPDTIGCTKCVSPSCTRTYACHQQEEEEGGNVSDCCCLVFRWASLCVSLPDKDYEDGLVLSDLCSLVLVYINSCLPPRRLNLT